MRTLPLTTSALAALMTGVCGAHAQTAAAAGAGTRLEEVIVTASRREESVQKSSLAIQVVGNEQLEQGGVTQAQDLAAVVPGLSIGMAGPAVQTYIRGVGSFGTDANAESAVAYSINGVYISRPNGIGPIFFDLARVEVLKGPQGTLYGRNASGGAINLITNRPVIGKIGADIAISAGNYGLVQGSGAVNIPVSSTFALRAAFQGVNHDGYLSDGYMSQETGAGRLMGLWQPTEAVSLLVTGEYSHTGGTGPQGVKLSTLTPNPSDHWEGPSSALSQPPTAAIGGQRIENDGFDDVTVKAVSAELNWDLGFATLTFLPAYRDVDAHSLTYGPGFKFDTFETSEQTSYELRLGDQTERLKWVAGLYYFNEDQTQDYNLYAQPIQRNVNHTLLSTESWAVFGEATIGLTDRLRFIAGARYSEDDKTQGGTTAALLPPPGGVTDLTGARKYEATTWRTGFEYDLSEGNMLFATVSTGYKAGGFFPAAAPFNSFQPEKMTAYTVGSRNRFLDNRLQVNLEGFYWDYKNKQERFLGALPSGTTPLVTTNAGGAILYGFDADVQFRVTSNDLITASVEYLKTRYDDFKYNVYNSATPGGGGALNSYDPLATSCRLGTPVDFLPTPNIPGFFRDSLQPVDCSGKPLVKAPKWSGSAAYQHTFPLANGSKLVAGIDAQFASEHYLTADFITSGEEDGYVLGNADLTYVAPEAAWSVTAWVRNITEENIYSGGFRYPFSSHPAQGGDPTLFYAQIRSPRTYGVRFNASF